MSNPFDPTRGSRVTPNSGPSSPPASSQDSPSSPYPPPPSLSPPHADSPRAGFRPTSIRTAVVAVCTLASVLLYLDRFCISFAEVYIKEELGLTDWQTSWMLSAFFWTYALAQVPSGWFSDRFGARSMLTLYIVLWSLFTAATGMAAFGFVTLMLLRFGFGIAQAGAYPTSAAVIKNWVPVAGRGGASGVVAVGGRVGGVLAFFLTGTLILWFVPTSVPSVLATRDFIHPTAICFELASAVDKADAADAANRSGDSSAEGDSADKKAPRDRAAELRRSLFNDMPAELQTLIRRNATRYKADLDAAVESERDRLRRVAASWRGVVTKAYWRPESIDLLKPGDVDPARPSPPIGDVAESLTGHWNGVIQSDRTLARRTLDAGFTPEPESLRLLKRLEADEGLTADELARMNRLSLQAVFPDSVRKVYGAAWRQVMAVFGFAGLAVAGLFWLVHRNHPRTHPWCNEAERELIEHGKPKTSGDRKIGGAPIRQLLASRSIWLLCIQQWFTNIGWLFLVTWLPRYLKQEHAVSVEWLRVLTTIPLICGWVGMVYGGRLTDSLARRMGLRWGRVLPMSLSRFLAMGAYVVCLFDPPLPVVLVAFSVVAFATDLGTGAVWAFNQDVGGRHVGSVLGWGNMWGNLGAAVAPPLMIWVVGRENNWTNAFVVCAVSFLLSGLAALWVNATRPIVPDEDETAAK